MNSKKLNKKLHLSKKTIANLSGDQIKAIKGGGGYETWEKTFCIPCDTYDMSCGGTCPSAVCTITCNCPTGTCVTCWPEQCV
jgi:hypothetical protein